MFNSGNPEREAMFSSFFVGKDTQNLFGFVTKNNLFVTDSLSVFNKITSNKGLIGIFKKNGFKILTQKDMTKIKLLNAPYSFDAVLRLRSKETDVRKNRSCSLVLFNENSDSISDTSCIAEFAMCDHLDFYANDGLLDNETIPPYKIKFVTKNNLFYQEFASKSSLCGGMRNIHTIITNVVNAKKPELQKEEEKE